MKTLQTTIAFFFILVFQKCTSITHVSGRYSNVYAEIAGQEFKFTQAPNKFEYCSRTEGMVRGFSAGTWIQNKRAILLSGFDKKNINLLDVESKTENYSGGNRDKILVRYRDNPLDTFIKVDLIINEIFKVRILGDTTFNTDEINTLQVKSYLAHEGVLLGTPPKIDTLYSTVIKASNANGQHKVISLNVDVEQKDFYRLKFADSLTVKDSRTLIWHNQEFKKIKQ